MAIDPVCGMKVDENQAAAKTEHQGLMYYFCSSGCHKEFTAHPEKYLAKNPDRERGGHARGS
ncbi:MAG: YHS domain-containing protein [Gammaproteobacteria bacterium]|nr:YHS domain-containing protein [Gammaproteobacteria bacterium]